MDSAKMYVQKKEIASCLSHIASVSMLKKRNNTSIKRRLSFLLEATLASKKNIDKSATVPGMPAITWVSKT